MFDELERRRAEVEAIKENSARVAYQYHKFESTGQGFVEFEDRLDFDITFIEEPFVQYGSQIDLDDLEELLDREAEADTDAPPTPLVSGYVTEWDTDDRGFFVGCWVGARVYFPPEDAVPADLQVNVTHFFTFTAIGMKDIPFEGARN